MQEYRHPNGSFARDVINAKSREELMQRLHENEAKRKAEGYTKTDERMLTRNSQCTCGSGKKIKRCCKFIK